MILFNLSSILNDPLGFLKELACLLPVMLLSLTLHEWGHAYTAYRCGDPTARNLGRLTLNPFAHLDPFGFLMILIAGFGWAKPVPINSRNFRNFKRDTAIVSLAGVTMNFLLVIVFSALYVLFFYFRYTQGYEWTFNEIIWKILLYGIILNVTLMLFNLLPVAPLDGYRVFELLFAKHLPIRVFQFLRRYGTFILIGIMILMRLFDFYPAYELSVWLIDQLDSLVVLLL